MSIVCIFAFYLPFFGLSMHRNPGKEAQLLFSQVFKICVEVLIDFDLTSFHEFENHSKFIFSGCNGTWGTDYYELGNYECWYSMVKCCRLHFAICRLVSSRNVAIVGGHRAPPNKSIKMMSKFRDQFCFNYCIFIRRYNNILFTCPIF